MILNTPVYLSVCMYVIIVSRSRAFKSRLAAWAERVEDTASGTLSLVPRRVRGRCRA